MKKVKVLLLVLSLSAAISCATSTLSTTKENHPEDPIRPVTEIQEVLPGNYTLSWNRTAPKGLESEREQWTRKLLLEIHQSFKELDAAKDIKEFCPSYDKLSQGDKEQFFAELFTRVAYKESGFNPKTIYKESFGVDSIGLYQLSYEDKRVYGNICVWDKATNSLKDPINNIQCAVRIAARLIGADKELTEGTSSKTAKGMAHYWSVMRSQSEAYAYIKDFTRNLGFCK